MPRKYAEDTTVGVAKSREDIGRLLQQWGARGVQWTDDFEAGRVTLRFQWAIPDVEDGPNLDVYLGARLSFQLPSAREIRVACTNRYGKVAEAKVTALMAKRGRHEHRVLLLWLKAAFNAVSIGLVRAEDLFLSYLEGHDGQTVGDAVVPRLSQLVTGSATKFFLTGGEE